MITITEVIVRRLIEGGVYCIQRPNGCGVYSRAAFIQGSTVAVYSCVHIPVNSYSEVVTRVLYNGVRRTAMSATWYAVISRKVIHLPRLQSKLPESRR